MAFSKAKVAPAPQAQIAPVQMAAGHAMYLAPALERVFCGVGWRGKGGQNIDVDASAICFSQGNPDDAVWWRNLQHPATNPKDMVRIAPGACNSDRQGCLFALDEY
jgi:hypothetical protein